MLSGCHGTRQAWDAFLGIASPARELEAAQSGLAQVRS